MGMAVIDSRKIYWTITFINTAVGEKCSLPLCGWCNRLCRYFKIDHYHHEDAPGSNIVWYWGLCLSCMSDTVPTSLACSWLDRTLVLCPFCWDGVRFTNMATSQVSRRSAPTVLSYISAPVCLFAEYTNKPSKGKWYKTATKDSVRYQNINRKPEMSKDYFCQNVSWDILQQEMVPLFWNTGLKKKHHYFYMWCWWK